MSIKTVIKKVNPASPERDVIRYAASVLSKGGLVIFPTETVYGLGGDVFNPEAVRKIFIVKRRPTDNPLIVHIYDLNMLYDVATDIPDDAFKIIEKAWPGPLTVILKKKMTVPREVTGGLDTVAVRSPGHPVALELIETANRPIAAPSANISGRPSPTSVEHVIKDMSGKVDLILDGGETFFGVESTVLDILSDPPVLLRPGPIDVDTLESILGKKIIVPDWARGYGHSGLALSPGTKYRHYSPVVPIILIESSVNDIEAIYNKILELASRERGKRIAVIASKETADVYEAKGIKTLVIGSRNNLYEIAKNLYQVLRKIDEMNLDVVFCEGFEERGIGLAIMNRLRKASMMIYTT